MASDADSRAMTPMVDRFIEAAVAHGQPANADVNGAEQDGSGASR